MNATITIIVLSVKLSIFLIEMMVKIILGIASLLGRGIGSVSKARGGNGAYCYIMHLPGQAISKFGITNNIDRRVNEHTRNGWTFHSQFNLASMDDARMLERHVKSHARSKGVLNTDKRLQAEMPQGGYTEVIYLAPNAVKQIAQSGVAA